MDRRVGNSQSQHQSVNRQSSIVNAMSDDWMRHMRRGDFASAWAISERLLQERAGTSCVHLPRHYQWIWDGRPLDGARVLIRCYHGLGDTIQFIRYAAMVKALARAVIVWAQPRLISLLRTVHGIDCLMDLHDGAPDVEYDVDLEVMELPFIFRTTCETVPSRVPYLHVDAEPLDRRNGPAVGLVWKAGDWAEHRSIPFTMLEPLTAVPVSWYVLQGEPGLSERPPGFGEVRGTHSLDEAARVIRSLDLLITIDSMSAHLGGALATPVWTLLADEADWRWMSNREDSPWYPTMRLFRQARPGNWDEVVERAAAELTRFAASWHDLRTQGPNLCSSGT
jgi:hypothetical protein